MKIDSKSEMISNFFSKSRLNKKQNETERSLDNLESSHERKVKELVARNEGQISSMKEAYDLSIKKIKEQNHKTFKNIAANYADTITQLRVNQKLRLKKLFDDLTKENAVLDKINPMDTKTAAEKIEGKLVDRFQELLNPLRNIPSLRNQYLAVKKLKDDLMSGYTQLKNNQDADTLFSSLENIIKDVVVLKINSEPEKALYDNLTEIKENISDFLTLVDEVKSEVKSLNKEIDTIQEEPS